RQAGRTAPDRPLSHHADAPRQRLRLPGRGARPRGRPGCRRPFLAAHLRPAAVPPGALHRCAAAWVREGRVELLRAETLPLPSAPHLDRDARGLLRRLLQAHVRRLLASRQPVQRPDPRGHAPGHPPPLRTTPRRLRRYRPPPPRFVRRTPRAVAPGSSAPP